MSDLPFTLLVSTHSLSRFGVFTPALRQLAAMTDVIGVDGMEFTETIITRLSGASRWRSSAEQHGTPIYGVHQSLGRLVVATLPSIERALVRAEALGASYLVVHLAAVRRLLYDPQAFAAIKAMQEKHRVTITFENSMAQFAAFKLAAFTAAQDPEGFAHITEQYNLPITYDVGHMAKLNTDLIAYFDRIRDRVMNIHLHDYYRGVDHMALGEGSLPIREFIAHLIRTNYTGYVTLEVFPLNTRPWLSVSQVIEVVRRSVAYVRESV